MSPTSKVGLSRKHPGLGNTIFHGNSGCHLNKGMNGMGVRYISILGARRSARRQMEAMQRQTQQVQAQSQPTASVS